MDSSPKRRKLLSPNDFDFFLVGNVEKCRPCRNAHRLIKDFINDNPDFTFGEWHFDWDEKSVVYPFGKRWLETQKEKDPKLRGYKYIPMIWIYGHFIGGYTELETILAKYEGHSSI